MGAGVQMVRDLSTSDSRFKLLVILLALLKSGAAIKKGGTILLAYASVRYGCYGNRDATYCLKMCALPRSGSLME